MQNNLLGTWKKKKRNRILTMLLSAILLAIAVWVLFWVFAPEPEEEVRVPEYRDGDLYFNSLSVKEQELYDQIWHTAELFYEYTEEISGLFTEEQFVGVLKALKADKPELYYLDISSLLLYSNNEESKVKLSYFFDSEVYAEKQRLLEAKISSILKGIDALGDYEKEIVLHDRLVALCSYDHEEEQIEGGFHDSAYGALVDGKADSEGYAAAFKLLLNRAGLVCYTVYGKIEGLSHAWNLVYIEDKFYHTDVSFNDGELEEVSDAPFHGYFNLTQEEILRNRTLENLVTLPVAGYAYDYYAYLGNLAQNETDFCNLFSRLARENVNKDCYFLEIRCDFLTDEETIQALVSDCVAALCEGEDALLLMPMSRVFKASAEREAYTVELFAKLAI